MKKKTIYDFVNGKYVLPKRYKIKNVGFENLKNQTLKYHIQTCSKVKYNRRKHSTIKDIGYKKLIELDVLGNQRWVSFFVNGGNVYIKSYSTKESKSNRILFDKSISKYIGKNVPLPPKPKQKKRDYIKGGKGGKVNGFNFYIQSNEKLSKKNRNILLEKGNRYIDNLRDNLSIILVNKKSFTNLDSNWTDSELVDYWNTFFSDYGFHIPDLIKHWEKLYHKDEFGESVSDNKEEIDFLKLGNFKPKTNRVEGMG